MRPTEPDQAGTPGLSSAHTKGIEEHGSIVYAHGGRALEMRLHGGKKPRSRGRGPGGPRGPITTMSEASRRRMRLTLASLDMGAVDRGAAVAMTLTWPATFPGDPREWKRVRGNFRDRMERAWPDVSGVWRLEMQRRGAPHMHALLLNVQDLPAFRAWCAVAWSAVCAGKGSRDPGHEAAGTSAARVRHWERYASYIAKQPETMAMVDEETGEVLSLDGVGRFWGTWGTLPIDRRMVELKADEVFRIRRAIWRYLGWRSRSRRAGLSAMVPASITERLITWARGLDGMRAPP